MIQYLGIVFVLLLMISCSAGGGAISSPGHRLQTYWPEIGVDRYEAVVFPAELPGP